MIYVTDSIMTESPKQWQLHPASLSQRRSKRPPKASYTLLVSVRELLCHEVVDSSFRLLFSSYRKDPITGEHQSKLEITNLKTELSEEKVITIKQAEGMAALSQQPARSKERQN